MGAVACRSLPTHLGMPRHCPRGLEPTRIKHGLLLLLLVREWLSFYQLPSCPQRLSSCQCVRFPVAARLPLPHL